MVTRPGSRSCMQSTLASWASAQVVSTAISAAVGLLRPGGGMSAGVQVLRDFFPDLAILERGSLVFEPIQGETRLGARTPWHFVQYWLSRGRTSLAKEVSLEPLFALAWSWWARCTVAGSSESSVASIAVTQRAGRKRIVEAPRIGRTEGTVPGREDCGGLG